MKFLSSYLATETYGVNLLIAVRRPAVYLSIQNCS
jgi:hypothetical protein